MSRTAALWDEWVDEAVLDDPLGPFLRGSLTPGSVTFPTTHLQFRVMIALGADLTASWLTWQWEDITRFVRYDVGISTRTGRPDQSTVVTPGRTVLKLDNRDGRFSRRNPTGPYYGLLSKNTPLWVQVDAGSGFRTRVQHYVNEWPTRWDKSGNDCTVTIVASGVLRRMAHSSALGSPLRRAILADAPDAYLPMEDGSNAVLPGSGLTTPAPVAVTTGASPNTASPVPAGSASGWNLSDGGIVRLRTEWPAGASPDGWEFEVAVGFDTAPTVAEGDLVTVAHAVVTAATGHPAAVVGVGVTLLSGILRWANYIYDASGSGSFTPQTGLGVVAAGQAYHLRVVGTQVGAGLRETLYVDGVAASPDGFDGTLEMPEHIVVNAALPVPAAASNPSSVSHLAIWQPYRSSATTYLAADGYAGEMAHERIERMCAVAGVTYASTGATARSQQLGPQPVATALQIIRDAESVDHGVVFESAFGLGYQGKQQRYNVPVGLALDFNASHIAEAPQPADDDQGTANRVAVSRTDGSEAIVEDSASVAAEGLYDDSETANTYTDEQLANIAGWHVHEGTIDEDRWPSLALNFLRNPGLIDTWTALPYGARLSADNPPPEVAPDPIDAFIEGHTEWFTPLDWRATVNTSPATVYEVYQVEADGNRGRVDTAGSSLVAAVDETTTSLSVASAGTIWVQGTVNFDLFVAGERVTVTNITGAASPQTFTVTRSVNGVAKTQSAGAAVRLWRPGAVAL